MKFTSTYLACNLPNNAISADAKTAPLNCGVRLPELNKDKKNMIPNIFTFATSELSQDAFICWLLSWAKPQYKDIDQNLHKTGVYFLNQLFDTGNIQKPITYDNVEVMKQYENIDVLTAINKQFVIIIEDKINTKNHGDQLTRYFDSMKRTYDPSKIIPIYFKTGDQSDYDEVKKCGYSLFLRKDILNVLKFGERLGVTNQIFRDYHSYIQLIEDDVNSYRTLPVEKWTWNSWIGFFMGLQQEFKDGEWDYVPNPSGGFLGIWWYWKTWRGYDVYLQLEFDKLCLRIHVKDSSLQSQYRNSWHQTIMKQSKNSKLKVQKPPRFGKGKWMTSAILSSDYRETDAEGKLDFQKTMEILHEAERLLVLAANSEN